jgi:hypothetical protein
MPDNEARQLSNTPHTPWNKGQADRSQASIATKARLVDQDPIDG